MRRRLRLGWLTVLGLAGAGLVLGTRLADPLAPPLYEGVGPLVAPYAYCSPPEHFRSTNKTPTAGSGTLQFPGGTLSFATVETADRQVLVYFPSKSVNPPPGGTSMRVEIVPLSVPPPPPAERSQYVGEAYLIVPAGSPPGPLPNPCGPAPTTVGGVPLAMAAQVLMRVPPVAYNNVRIYYDGVWHRVTWGAQQDYANAAIDHFGLIAAFNEAGGAPTKPPSRFPIGILELALTVAAVLVIGAGVVFTRLRARQERG